jgi:RNA polymerase sigma-70 factor, ECF subfamily
MSDTDLLAEDFEKHRRHLQAVAYRLLGSVAEAEDAVQDTWLRLQRVDFGEIADLRSWLTVAIGRLCLDRLRSARNRRETYVGEWLPDPLVGEDVLYGQETLVDPADSVSLDESVGLALMVVLETLSPAQRTAFVLHEIFGVPFDEIAVVVGRSPAAVRQLASRARQRLHSQRPRFDADPAQQRATIAAFLTAARDGDLNRLIQVLDPEVVWRTDAGGLRGAPQRPIRGAQQVAAMVTRQASTFVAHARIVTVNGAPGVAVVEGSQLHAVIGIAVAAGRITEVDAVYNPEKLHHIAIG